MLPAKTTFVIPFWFATSIFMLASVARFQASTIPQESKAWLSCDPSKLSDDQICFASQERETDLKVESRIGAVAWGLWPTPRFLSPLIKPGVPISGTRLSDWLHREAHDGRPIYAGVARQRLGPLIRLRQMT